LWHFFNPTKMLSTTHHGRCRKREFAGVVPAASDL
jgi:hypothetical protein